MYIQNICCVTNVDNYLELFFHFYIGKKKRLSELYLLILTSVVTGSFPNTKHRTNIFRKIPAPHFKLN